MSIGLYGIDRNEGISFIGFDKQKKIIVNPVLFDDKIDFDTKLVSAVRFDPIDQALIMNHPLEGVVKISWETGFQFPMSSTGVKKEMIYNNKHK